MKQLVEYCDRTYIINLEDRLDRRKEVAQEFRRLGMNNSESKRTFLPARRLTNKRSFPDDRQKNAAAKADSSGWS